MTLRLTNPNLLTRIAWGYALYLGFVLSSFAIGYFFLPRGALLGTPWTYFGSVAALPTSLVGQLLTTVGFNLVFVLALGVGLNLQRVRGFPTGYIFIFSAAIVSGLTAGTNSFILQIISPYTLEGWLIALRIQHLELLGYTVIIASTISIGLSDFSSWFPWRAKSVKIQEWFEVRFTRQEVMGIVLGVFLVLLAGYNEAALVF